jgi:hypothetical protein
MSQTATLTNGFPYERAWEIVRLQLENYGHITEGEFDLIETAMTRQTLVDSTYILDHVDISRSMLKYHRDRGYLTSFRKVGRSYVYHLGDVKSWVAKYGLSRISGGDATSEGGHEK